MAYSSEVVAKARMRLAQAKANRERDHREHLEQAYCMVPRLKEIDHQLRVTMAKAAQAVFAGGDAQTLMERAKQENQQLQQERKKLLDDHLAPGFLDENPICPVCGGTGYVGSTMCKCLRELCRQEQRKELTLLSAGQESFEQFRLDYYPNTADPQYGIASRAVMEKTFEICQKYAYGFTPNAGNLLFSGNTGLGKTFLSACIAKSVADAGYSVVYESATHLFTCLERARFDADEDSRIETNRYDACDLLIIDDLGTEFLNQFVTAALYNLINTRLVQGKPTIVSTNLAIDEISVRYGAQIASRLRGSYRRVPFVGEDIRLLKNRG